MRLPHAVLGAAVLAACAPRGDAASLMAEETGTLACSGQETVYTNHTANARDVHVRLSNRCDRMDTMAISIARIRILDAQGQVFNNQDESVAAHQTHRGTFTVPAGGRIQLTCGEGDLGDEGCPWRYSY